MNLSLRRTLIGLFLLSLILLLWNYSQGYDQSINWEVTTTAEVIEFPAWSFDNGFMEQTITGEKYLLQERYSGSRVLRNLNSDMLYLCIMWLGLCLFLTASTYFNRYLFFAVMAALALFINRLNLFDVGLFGINHKLVMLIPFIGLGTPLVYFQEYRKDATFFFRLIILLCVSVGLGFGIEDRLLFVDHFTAHTLFSFGICALVFLFLIAEELVFSLLFVVTSSKGAKSNHIHFILLSLIYVGNLALYYLNKSGRLENTFFFFDPYILLVISSIVALWSLQHKKHITDHYMPNSFITIVCVGLGLITFGYLSFSMNRGMDAVYESFHYFILYFHLGFGFMFLLYTIANFIDPLIQGLEVYKIVYRERNFPYLTARLGGLACICGFYFLAGQEPYNLLRSGYYNYLSVKEENAGEELLANEYMTQAGFLGYNTHYPNYRLAWNTWDRGNEFNTKSYFFNATQRFPSPYAWVNYGNIEAETNANKVRATYEEALRHFDSPEMENNLGIIHLANGNIDLALGYFENAVPSGNWNQAPKINKWNVYKKVETIDSTALPDDYLKGNFGVRANILTTTTFQGDVAFIHEGLRASAPLHRQAYLLNSSILVKHDSLASLIREEIENTTDASTANRLSKALALHVFNKGDINAAFLLLDGLQARAHQYYKGAYLDALGKLALSQGAYQLSLDFFDRALEVKHNASRISRLEALAGLSRKEEITDELLKIIKKDPGLTAAANQLLERLENYHPFSPTYEYLAVDKLSSEEAINLAGKNAFNESLILEVVDLLERREHSGGYELLIESMEINPYSVALIKRYVIAALDWNLVNYADQSMERLEQLMPLEEFNSFEATYQQKKLALSKEEW